MLARAAGDRRRRPADPADVLTDAERAVAGADVVATDTWVSMGKEDEAAAREPPFLPYSVTAELLAGARADAIVLHCLPAYRGKEISAEVIDGPQSVVWDEAENRLHAQKALMPGSWDSAADDEPRHASRRPRAPDSTGSSSS